MTYGSTLKLKGRKNFITVGDFIKSIDEKCDNKKQIDSISSMQIPTRLYEVKLSDGNEFDIKNAEKNLVAIIKIVREQEPAEVKTYLKNVGIAINLSFTLAIIGVILMFAVVLHTYSIGDWILCFVSWLVGCTSLGSTLVLISKEWQKERYGTKMQRKRGIRNQTRKFNYEKR